MDFSMDRRNFVKAAMGSAIALGFAGSASFAFADDAADDGAASMTGDIYVYSREDGSGTRGAFIELFGIEQENEDGEKVDMTTATAAITNSTAVMMTTVASDPQGIGYISLGSVNETVKALKIDGVDPSVENVENGTYKIVRPFNIVTTAEVGDLAQDFINYIMSADGQTVVEGEGYVPVAKDAEAYEATGMSGTLTVAGSSSVTPVMEKLAEAYEGLNPDVNIEVQQSDSTTGVTMALEGSCENRHGLPRPQGLRDGAGRRGDRHRPGRHRRHRLAGQHRRRPARRPGEVHLHRRGRHVGGRACPPGPRACR